jgi:plasmid stability protein
MGLYWRWTSWGGAMADVKIRRLEDWVVAAHRNRAEQAGRSLEKELRVLLTAAALEPQRDFAREVPLLREEIRKQRGTLSDSTELIRAEREARG